MGEGPVYLVAVVHITDPEAFERSRRAASSASSATADRYGARFVARGTRAGGAAPLEVIEGALSPDRVTVIEYPSMGHVRRWLASEEYAKTRAQRDGAADFSLFLVPADV